MATKPHLLHLLLLPILLLLATGTAVAQSADGDHMTFSVSAGFTTEYDTDSVRFFRNGQVMEVIGYVEHNPTRYRKLHLTIPNFTGVGTYQAGSTTARWDNFSQDSLCRGTSGTITITEWDSAGGRLAGTFIFDCESRITSGDVITYEVENGIFTVVQKPELGIDVIPANQVTMRPKDTVRYHIVISDPSGNPQPNAEVRVHDSVQTLFNRVVGTTNDSGRITHTVVVPVGLDTGTYALKFWATHPNHEDSDTITRLARVDSTLQVWNQFCNGLMLLTFDVGNGNAWQDAGLRSIENNGTVTINGFVKFDGRMRIDTTPGAESIDADGRLYIPGTSLPGGSTGDFVLYEGSTTINPRCGVLTAPLGELVSNAATKLAGFSLGIEEFSFINGTAATGISVKASIKLPRVTSSCASGTTPQPDTAKVTIGFKITNVAADLSFQVQGLGVAPGFCISDFAVSYSSPRDSLDLDVKVKTPIVEFGGGIGLVNGGLNRISGRFDLARPIPIGTTPLAFKGARLSISGIQVAPFVFSTGGTVVSSVTEDLFEIDSDGTYTHPLKFSVAGALRMAKTPGTEIWQAVGTMTGTADLNASVSLSGTLKAGSFGGTAFALDGAFSGQYAWSPTEDVTGSINGALTIPNFSSNWPFDWVNSILGLPHTLASAEANYRSRIFVANLDLTNAPPPYNQLGRMHVRLDLNRESSDPAFFSMGEGTVPLNRTVRIDDPASSIAGGPELQRSLPIVRAVDAKGSQPSAAIFLDTVVVDGTAIRLIVRLSSQATVPASSVIGPDGTVYQQGTDPKVIYSTTPDGRKAFWTVMDPAPGAWVVSVTDPTPTDSIDFYAIMPSRPFAITAANEGEMVVVRWLADDLPPADSEVDIYLDTDDEGFDGFLIGTVDETAGEFAYAIPDSLPNCSYNVYAVRNTPGDMRREYALNPIENPKSILPAPTNITVVPEPNGRTLVTWTKTTDATAAGYTLHVIDASFRDSVYAAPYAWQEEAVIDLPAGPSTIYMVAFNEAGWSGCPSTTIGATVGVEDEVVAGERGSIMSDLSLYPNPSEGSTSLRFRLSEPSIVSTTLYDVVGRPVLTVDGDLYGEGDHELPLPTALLPNGSYMVLVRAGEGWVIERLEVVR